VLGGFGVACQRADAGKAAGLKRGVAAAPEQAGVGREKLEQPGETTSREAVAAADARAFLKVDGLREAVRGELRVRDLERLFEADRPAQALRADRTAARYPEGARAKRRLSRVLDREDQESLDQRRFGAFGAASPCWRIDPRTGRVIGTIARRRSS
jgi:hypothetical protein